MYNDYMCPKCEARAIKTVYYDFDKTRYKEVWFRCGSKQITEMGNVKWLVHFNQDEECKKTVLLGDD